MIKEVVTADGEESMYSAIRRLYERHVGSILVTDGEGNIEGIFTERDALRNIVGEVSMETPLRRIMTRNPITIGTDRTFAEAIDIMSTHGVRQLPVVDDEGRLTGIFSLRCFLDEVVGIPGDKI